MAATRNSYGTGIQFYCFPVTRNAILHCAAKTCGSKTGGITGRYQDCDRVIDAVHRVCTRCCFQGRSEIGRCVLLQLEMRRWMNCRACWLGCSVMAFASFDSRVDRSALRPSTHDFGKLNFTLSGNLSSKGSTGTNAPAAAPFVDGD